MTTKQRGRSFITEFMVAGERYRATFDTYEEGERWELEVRHALKMGRPIPEANTRGRVQGGSITTFRQVADYALRNNWTDSPDYRIVVSRYADQMAEFFGDNIPMSAIKRSDIDALVAFLRDDRGNSSATINRKLSALSSFFKTASVLDVIDQRPPFPRRLKERSHKLRFVYPEEEQRIIRTAITFEDQELADLIMFAIDTGARFSEITKAKWDWFTPSMASWIIWLRKADNPMGMPLTSRVREMLHRRKGEPSGPFCSVGYASVRHRLERVLTHLDLEDITFHTFRHTTASRLVQRGVDLRRVQTWMGHKAIATTIRYAKLAPNDLEDMAGILEAA